MSDFRTVTDSFVVSPQITPSDVADAAALGVTLIINNRPDAEAPGQPSGGSIEATAKAQGLDYVHIPVVGRPTSAQVEAMQAAVAGAHGKVLAYCRSGTRSIAIWALGSDQPRDTLVRLGAAAGYDLGAILP